jgi:glycosyltransferase involved in cell wall biosynthesis
MKKKVLILGKLPPPYMGPAIATSILLNSGLKERYDLIHLDVRAHKDINQLGRFSFKKIFRNFSIYFKLNGLIKKEQPDLTLIPIAQTTIGFFKDAMFILIASAGKGKVLVQLRGSGFRAWYESAGPITKKLTRYTLSKAEGVIVLGEKLRYLFEPFFNLEKIFVAPNGADYRIVPGNRSEDASAVNLLYLANLQGSKGIEDVIRGINILKEDPSLKFKLTVAGAWRDVHTKEVCTRLVKDHSLPVEFIGPVQSDRKMELLGQSDIFIFTPREPEGHPWVIVESMAAGLPVISTDQGAITESVIDGENGFIVDPYSPEQISKKLSELINNTELRKSMGSASLRSYESKFNESAMVRNYSAIFNKVLF